MTFTHLGWSLLGVSEDLDPMAIVDLLSEILVRIFYASFLVMAVVLLVNLLIALLSNTYQRTEVRRVNPIQTGVGGLRLGGGGGGKSARSDFEV